MRSTRSSWPLLFNSIRHSLLRLIQPTSVAWQRLFPSSECLRSETDRREGRRLIDLAPELDAELVFRGMLFRAWRVRWSPAKRLCFPARFLGYCVQRLALVQEASTRAPLRRPDAQHGLLIEPAAPADAVDEVH